MESSDDEYGPDNVFIEPRPKLSNNILSDSEHITVIKKARKDAMYQFYKTMFLRDMVERVQDGIFPLNTKNKAILAVQERTMDRIQSKPPYMMITVNVQPDIKLPELMKRVKKFTSKKTIKSYAYVYEVRKPNKGLHCHMLVHYTPRPYEFKRGAKNTFKTVCDANNPHCLNFKFVTLDLLSDKYRYLLGEKSDKKKTSLTATVEYRKKHNLLDLYESSPPLPCRATIESTTDDERNLTISPPEVITPYDVGGDEGGDDHN